MQVSIPVDSNRDLSHLAMVLDVTALWGLMIARNNLVSRPLFEAVCSSYAITGHMPASDGNEGKKKVTTGFPCLDCLARLAEINTTPSGLYCFPLISS
jgi:hypothetical protein